MAGSSRHDPQAGAELQGGVLIDKLCGGGSDIILEGSRSNLRHGTYGAWLRDVGNAVLLVALCMTPGGVSLAEFGSVKCTIKRSKQPCCLNEKWGVGRGSKEPCVWSQKGPVLGTVKLV